MTPYDAWRTNVDETNEEAWEDAAGEVAYELAGRTSDMEEWVSIIANSDEALKWVCGAVTIPDHHIHKFRDLVKLAQNIRSRVEKEMKVYRDARD